MSGSESGVGEGIPLPSVTVRLLAVNTDILTHGKEVSCAKIPKSICADTAQCIVLD